MGKRGKEGQRAAQGLGEDLRPPVAGGWGSGHCPGTHGPDSTWMEPTFSSRLSVRLGHSAESSHRLPWKFSNSYTVTWKDKDERLAPWWAPKALSSLRTAGRPHLLPPLPGESHRFAPPPGGQSEQLQQCHRPYKITKTPTSDVPSKASACFGRVRVSYVTLLPSSSPCFCHLHYPMTILGLGTSLHFKDVNAQRHQETPTKSHRKEATSLDSWWPCAPLTQLLSSALGSRFCEDPCTL